MATKIQQTLWVIRSTVQVYCTCTKFAVTYDKAISIFRNFNFIFSGNKNVMYLSQSVFVRIHLIYH